MIEAGAYKQNEIFKAGIDFAKCEGVISAPESDHAVKAAFDEAIKCKIEKKKKVILFNL